MRHSDDIKDIFWDMQQHPENYSDGQIEEMMAELDKPVDVEAAWQDFSHKYIAGETKHAAVCQPAKRIYMRWMHGIAAMAVAALGIWGIKTFTTRQEVLLLTENTANGEYCHKPDDINPDHMQSDLLIAQTAPMIKDTTNTHTEVASKKIQSGDKIQVRGTRSLSKKDEEPLVIVNGRRIAKLDLLEIFNVEDIDSIRVYKDEEKKAEYEARFGTPAKHGIINITLKTDCEHAYADILNPVSASWDVYSQVEKKPEFPGGEDALTEYLKENVKYPAEFPDSLITGRVMVSFVVASDGSTRDFKIIRCRLKNADMTACTDSTIIGIFTDEAIRACRMMPRWTPGGMYTNDGYKKVNVRYTVPIRFGRQDTGAQTGTGLRIRGDRNDAEHSQHRDRPRQ